ncbi:unnamed protein product [Arctia plantaginis]|uniref:Uncharacterized protein n=1 Tax=Arctia plantaginis TaxID=874455 RepID=A0A8S0YZH4_ARCPL|nr:unnamed protein product [Arctia plantaginis]
MKKSCETGSVRAEQRLREDVRRTVRMMTGRSAWFIHVAVQARAGGDATPRGRPAPGAAPPLPPLSATTTHNGNLICTTLSSVVDHTDPLVINRSRIRMRSVVLRLGDLH